MICLIILACFIAYYRYKEKHSSFDKKKKEHYNFKKIVGKICFITIFIISAILNISTILEYQDYTRKAEALEYQKYSIFERDANYFEQLTDYNNRVERYQKLNKEKFFFGITINDKWDKAKIIEIGG